MSDELIQKFMIATVLYYVDENRKNIPYDELKTFLTDTLRYDTFSRKYFTMVALDTTIPFNIRVDMVYYTVKMIERYGLINTL